MRLYEILRAYPQGLSEYDLLNILRKDETLFQTDRTESIALFRQHFILFHALYLLDQTLSSEQAGQLQISPLQIQLAPYRSDSAANLTRPDPLRRYYLDPHHLYQTDAAEIEAMLDDFWQRLARADQRSEALQVLGLNDPVDDADIRRRYRELVMVHHPDRGGETARLQLFNAAVAVLLPGKDRSG